MNGLAAGWLGGGWRWFVKWLMTNPPNPLVWHCPRRDRSAAPPFAVQTEPGATVRAAPRAGGTAATGAGITVEVIDAGPRAVGDRLAELRRAGVRVVLIAAGPDADLLAAAAASETVCPTPCS